MIEFNKRGLGPEFEGRIVMTRSLSDVSSANYYFGAHDLLRSRFIPGFDSWKYKQETSDSLEWLKNAENKANFIKTFDHPENRKNLPDFVQRSHRTINLFLQTGWEVEKQKGNPIYKVPVAFELNSEQFKTDLHSIVYPLFDQLKNYDPEKGNFKLERKNDPKDLFLISKFYETVGYAYRDEAPDIVSPLLFSKFWETLKTSAKILAAPEMRLNSKTRFPGAAVLKFTE